MKPTIVLFTILVVCVCYSQQQRRRTNVQVIRNLEDSNDLVQRYEETPPIRPLRRQQPAAAPAPRPAKRPRTRPRAESQPAPAPKPKVERKLFNVLLRTSTGFDETAGYSING